ncbi:tRNA(Met) cytidine acetyltransferase TmcA [Oceanimonas sp. MB9]|uniref:tRNA(Met) cytidine acetyltransferase TmcA n=1 Tax=Oceanimonas sp. MB9 TaxID=2588453 RepID=UPI0013F5F9CF|nr:GNAT family N-acetyltransferase [Oceanimonas sp. MB9]NHI00131.1 tRNA(Met) cytidine acetyltransferase TmcA [Oceanimonas sp. MB9]
MTDWPGFCRQLLQRGERRLLIVSGEQDWAQARAQSLLTSLAPAHILWLGEAPFAQPHCPLGKFHTALGREYHHLVFNAFSGLHPDALGAAVGALAAGGLLVLLCPPLQRWHAYADPDLRRYVALPEQAEGLNSRFITRAIALLRSAPGVLLWQQHRPAPTLPLLSGAPWRLQRDRHGCLNRQQRHALTLLLRGARRGEPVVLTADRGRGKSSLLGLAAGRLLRTGKRVLLTAPSPDAAARALAHCEPDLPFMAPDALLAERPAADVVLVDEAAALPVPMLLALARRYCCLFASTEHGYEGTGLGFTLKFQPALAALSPTVGNAHIGTPARWSQGDPLEPLLFRLLALDSNPPAPPSTGAPNMEWVTRQRLLADDTLLQQVFGLLTLAHYQTRPSDLRQLLDAPGVSLAVVFRQGVPVAAALLQREGELDGALATAIWRGQRRPRGHLLPQSLCFHGGLMDACDFGYARIMRIVVHPACQQAGIGSQLLGWLKQQVNTDFLGTSFGASPELLTFWSRNGFLPVRLGLAADGVSGLHAAMMLWPASSRAQSVLHEWQGQFGADMRDEGRTMPAGLPLPPPRVNEQRDAQRAHDFACYHRDLHADRPALRRFIAHNTPVHPPAPHQQALLQTALHPGAEPAQVAKRLGYAGQKSVITALRLAMKCYF